MTSWSQTWMVMLDSPGIVTSVLKS